MAAYSPEEAFEEAERRSEEARRTSAPNLDLGGLDLTAVPESIGQLEQLQELNLSDNGLTVLPESIGQLAQLQVLNLNSNQLTILPESIGQLTQLQTLQLSPNKLTPKHCPLTEDVTECIGGARGLSEADLERAYHSPVDPRLNAEQALEMALRIVRKYKGMDR